MSAFFSLFTGLKSVIYYGFVVEPDVPEPLVPEPEDELEPLWFLRCFFELFLLESESVLVPDEEFTLPDPVEVPAEPVEPEPVVPVPVEPVVPAPVEPVDEDPLVPDDDWPLVPCD